MKLATLNNGSRDGQHCTFGYVHNISLKMIIFDA